MLELEVTMAVPGAATIRSAKGEPPPWATSFTVVGSFWVVTLPLVLENQFLLRVGILSGGGVKIGMFARGGI